MSKAAEHLETVRAFYEAYCSGNIAGVLAPLAEDIEWEVFNFPNAATSAGAY
jgi:ketosteroid isomerase-like protein